MLVLSHSLYTHIHTHTHTHTHSVHSYLSNSVSQRLCWCWPGTRYCNKSKVSQDPHTEINLPHMPLPNSHRVLCGCSYTHGFHIRASANIPASWVCHTPILFFTEAFQCTYLHRGCAHTHTSYTGVSGKVQLCCLFTSVFIQMKQNILGTHVPWCWSS